MFRWLLFLLMVSDQSEDVHQRLLRLLGPDAGQRANALLAQKRFAEVEAMLPPREQALRGVLEFMNDRMDNAARLFQNAAATAPLRRADRFTLAMAWVRLGRDAEARDELTQLAAQDPGSALYAYWLGRLDYDQRRYAEAVEQLKRATVLDANSARAWDSLGLAYDMQGNAEDALRALKQGALLNRQQPRPSPWPPHDLGAMLLRTGDIKLAEKALREALDYDPAMQQAHYHLARVLEKEDANDQAVAEYLAALQVDDQAADVYYSLALLYRKMHKEKEAQAAFSEWRRCKAATGSSAAH